MSHAILRPGPIQAPRITPDVNESTDACALAFANGPSFGFQQAWLPVHEPRFQPGQVQVGWDGNALHLRALLHDEDIFNPANTRNAMAFLQGDAFEVFLAPPGQAAYYEFHVTPNNVPLQLRLVPQENGQHPKSELIEAPLFTSRTSVDNGKGIWCVVMQVPLQQLCETRMTPDAGTWRFSCGRYDWTRGHAKPVISSIAPHQQCNFHRRHEWFELNLSAV